MADRTPYGQLEGAEPNDEQKLRVLQAILEQQANPAVQQARQQAMAANAGPLGWLVQAGRAGGEAAKGAIDAATAEPGYGAASGVGTSPGLAGSQAVADYQRLQPLIDAYRQMQAKRFLESVFMPRLAQKGK